MRLIPTLALKPPQEVSNEQLRSGYDNGPGGPLGYVDVSVQTPDDQFQTLVNIIEADDAANPAPDTSTPPWGEPTDESEWLSQQDLDRAYMPLPDIEASVEADLPSVIADAYGNEIPRWTWQNDDQYYGLGVPPGVENVQPYESGHTQITLPDPSSEHGWDSWSGRPIAARVARHENDFPGYMAGQQRGHNIRPLKFHTPYYVRTQQNRDLLLAEIQRRGIHNVVIAGVPAVPYSDQVQVVDPTLEPMSYYADTIPEEGVLP